MSLIVLACVGCGLESVEPDPLPAPAPPPIRIVDGDAGITRTVDGAGNARYLGEVENLGEEVACNIRVTVNSYDNLDNLLTNPANPNLGFADLLGESFRFSAFTNTTMENCLAPSRRASFDVRNDFPPSRVARIEASTTCDGSLYEGCLGGDQTFTAPVATLALFGDVIQDVTGDGRVKYTGVIRNQSPPGFATTYHVKIVLSAKNSAGLVVDVACATMAGPDCPLPQGSTASNSGLGPGDLWSFSVEMSIQPGDTCANCFSYVINQKPTL